MTTNIRFFADWQILGNVEPREYLTEILEEAKAAGSIKTFDIKLVEGPQGSDFYYVYFTVDVQVKIDDMGAEDLRKHAERLLNAVAYDSDVSVRWFEFLS